MIEGSIRIDPCWLVDGEKRDSAYADFVHYLHGLDLPLYKISRALHLFQNHWATMSVDGSAPPPHTINLCVNNVCNLKCSYCDLAHGRAGEGEADNTKVQYNLIERGTKHELPLETCKRIIDETAWFRPTIRVPWMEPLLYKDLIPLIEYTKSKDLPFSLLTNGLLLHKFAQRFSALKVDAIRVSLDGPSRIHDTLCGVKDAFDRIVFGLKACKHYRFKNGYPTDLGCYFTLNGSNFHSMVEFLDSLDRKVIIKDVFIGFYAFNYISPKMAHDHNAFDSSVSGTTVEQTSCQYTDLSKIDIDLVVAQRKEIEERFIKRGARIHFRPEFTKLNLQQILNPDAARVPSSHCTTHWHTLFVNPEGYVKSLPQCILEPVGNVNEQSVMEIWNGEKMREQRIKLREHGPYAGCMRCWSVYSYVEDNQGSWKHGR